MRKTWVCGLIVINVGWSRFKFQPTDVDLEESNSWYYSLFAIMDSHSLIEKQKSRKQC